MDGGHLWHSVHPLTSEKRRFAESKKVLRLEGIYPPIPTPFDAEGKVATNALTENVRVWNQHKLRGYVVLGSNGELIMLNDRERLQVLETARAAIPSDKLMIAGTGCH